MADFLTLSPEVNSARMYAGGGPGSLSAAAAAWDELAAELWLAAASFESVCSGLADRWWQGPSSRMMAAQAARHTGWLAAAATQAEGAASQAQTMALAYEAAFAATVHPALVAANRALVAWLAGSNVFGQNTPAIAAAEAIYEQMWAQDVVAMLNYHAVASAVGARLRPWQQLLHELPRRLGGEHSDSTNTELANPSSTTTRITVPGASPVHAATLLPFIGRLLAARYAELNTAIGTNWFPGTTPEVVSYPATIGVLSGSLGAVDANQSIAIGQQMLHNEILAATASGQPVTVAGLSMGSMVIDRELAYLAIDPNAPPSSALTFVELAGPERGLAQTYLPVGTTIPIAGYTVGNAPESQYNTSRSARPSVEPVGRRQRTDGRGLLSRSDRLRRTTTGDRDRRCHEFTGRNHDNVHDSVAHAAVAVATEADRCPRLDRRRAEQRAEAARRRGLLTVRPHRRPLFQPRQPGVVVNPGSART